MNLWFVSIAVAGFVGSLHCVGMCGPLVVVAGGCSGLRASVPLYQLGRLLSYALLGALAGSVGLALDVGAGRLLGLGHVATVVASVGMIVAGVVGLTQFLGWLPRSRARRGAQTLLVTLGRPRGRAFGLGTLSALMPCGWLYSFALVAAGLADPVRGSLAMVAFWLGTLPALLAVAVVGGRLTRRTGRWAPLFVALALLATGVFGLVHRSQIELGDPACCDHEAPP